MMTYLALARTDKASAAVIAAAPAYAPEADSTAADTTAAGSGGSSSQTKLAANLAAQIVAFALGKQDDNANKNFPGERPSSLIHGDKLTPSALGALLAHFENKVMFQGLVWNINSFDQEGVQLGKVLTKKVLAGGGSDPVLAGYARLLGITF